MSILKHHYGKAPIIYVAQEFYDEYVIDDFFNYPIWIRDIYGQPELGDGREWLIWQYANRGHLKGIDTYVDPNVYNSNACFVFTGNE